MALETMDEEDVNYSFSPDGLVKNCETSSWYSVGFRRVRGYLARR